MGLLDEGEEGALGNDLAAVLPGVLEVDVPHPEGPPVGPELLQHTEED